MSALLSVAVECDVVYLWCDHDLSSFFSENIQIATC